MTSSIHFTVEFTKIIQRSSSIRTANKEREKGCEIRCFASGAEPELRQNSKCSGHVVGRIEVDEVMTHRNVEMLDADTPMENLVGAILSRFADAPVP